MSDSLKRYELTEAIRKLEELVNRVQQGEEILLLKDGNPVAWLIGPTDPHEQRSRILRELFTDKQIEELSEAIETPLSEDDQRILEGEGTDEVGIWVGLQAADQQVPEPEIPGHTGRRSKLLLDSHALFWWVSASPHLSARAKAAISAKNNEVVVSVVSLYELLFNASLGKLAMSVPALQALLDSCTLGRMSVTAVHAQVAANIKWLHRDPWDRLLAAQAITEQAYLISNDAVFDQVGIHRIW